MESKLPPDYYSKKTLAANALMKMANKIDSVSQRGTASPTEIKRNKDQLGYVVNFFQVTADYLETNNVEGNKNYKSKFFEENNGMDQQQPFQINRSLMDSETIRRMSLDRARAIWPDHY